MLEAIQKNCLDCGIPLFKKRIKRCINCSGLRTKEKHKISYNNWRKKDINKKRINEYQKKKRLNRTDNERIKSNEYQKEYQKKRYRIKSGFYFKKHITRKEINHSAYLKRRESGKIAVWLKNHLINPENKITARLRSSIWDALNRNDKNGKKYFLFNNLIGCSPSFLITYLESKFIDDMDWNNYGMDGWHIDHIKPCSLFDLTKPEEQKKCFHYTNLQPLWAIDNFKKGNKFI